MRLNMKIGAAAMAAAIALGAGVMWAMPASAQDETTERAQSEIVITSDGAIPFAHDEVQQAGLEAAAERLGMTPEEVEDALWGGKTLADLAETADVPLSDVRAAVEEAMQAARQTAMRTWIADRVESGRMTQEHADWMLEGIDNGWFGLGRFAGRFDGLGHGGLGHRRFGHREFGRDGFGLEQGPLLDLPQAEE